METCGTAIGASLLQPVKYPTVANDYSFTERLENLAADYENYAELSAYEYISLVDEEEAAHAAIEAHMKMMGLDKCENCDENGNPPPQDGSTYYVILQPGMATEPAQGTTPGVAEPATGGTVNATGAGASGVVAPATGNAGSQMRQGGGYCSLRHPRIPQGQKVPLGLPVNMADMPAPSTFKDPKGRTDNIINNTLKGQMCSPYGCRTRPNKSSRPHTGVDIGCTKDFYRQPIYAVADGVVTGANSAQKGKPAGNYITIDHGGGWKTQYMHLDQMVVSKGQQVSAGCLIGYMGHTGGNADQKNPSMGIDITHLHYEILYSGTASNLSTPSGKNIPIKRHGTCGNGKGFKTKIEPNQLMIYYGG